MQINKLFNALVVGGALMAGCASAQVKTEPSPTAEKKTENAARETESTPARPSTTEPATQPASEKKSEDAKCVWY